MYAFRVYVEGYQAESSAYVLADGAIQARDLATHNLDPTDDQRVNVDRRFDLDGDDLTDERLWHANAYGWIECTCCGETMRRERGQVPVFREGAAFCSDGCHERIKLAGWQPTPQTLVMIGTEY